MSEEQVLNLESLNSSLSHPNALEDYKQTDTLDFVMQQEQSSTSNSSKKGQVPQKKRIQKTFNSNQKKNSGHWTQQEHQTYVEFLQQHHQTTMQNTQNRKNNKIFKQMSEIIGTRSPSQCRSHHQKFNPYTPAGQKRIKKSRKRTCTESQINVSVSDVQIKMPMTPELKKMPHSQQETEVLTLNQLFQFEQNSQPLLQMNQVEDNYEYSNQNDYQYNYLPRIINYQNCSNMENVDDYFNNNLNQLNQLQQQNEHGWY